MAQSTNAAFRLVELVSLLLPIVLVILQFTVRYYRNNETGSPATSQLIILIAIAIITGFTIFAGAFSIQFLITSGFDQDIQISLQLLQGAVVLFIVPVVVILLMAFSEVLNDLPEGSRIKQLVGDSGSESDQGEKPKQPKGNSSVAESEESQNE